MNGAACKNMLSVLRSQWRFNLWPIPLLDDHVPRHNRNDPIAAPAMPTMARTVTPVTFQRFTSLTVGMTSAVSLVTKASSRSRIWASTPAPILMSVSMPPARRALRGSPSRPRSALSAAARWNRACHRGHRADLPTDRYRAGCCRLPRRAPVIREGVGGRSRPRSFPAQTASLS